MSSYNFFLYVKENEAEDCYKFLIRKKGQLSNHAKKFKLTTDDIKKVFILPHNVVEEPYVKAFELSYTNSKLYKIGSIKDSLCTFCGVETET